MLRMYRALIAVSWGLGLLSLIGGLMLKLAPTLARICPVNPPSAVEFPA